MVKALIIAVVGVIVLLLLTGKVHINNMADKLYPWLAQSVPLERSMIESAKHKKLVEKYEEIYNKLDQADYLFFGDSHIQYFNVGNYFPKSRIVNYGITGDTTEGVIRRLPTRPPKNKISQGILFMVGYNDLKYKDVDQITSNHRRMILAASKQLDMPFSKIILQSLFPVSKERLYVNKSIMQINAAGKALCAELGCVFLDLYSNFADSENGLQEQYSQDGVHLNEKGYEMWASLLTKSLNI